MTESLGPLGHAGLAGGQRDACLLLTAWGTGDLSVFWSHERWVWPRCGTQCPEPLCGAGYSDASALLLQTANGNVEAKVVCFYRRRDISSTLIALADKHASESRPVPGEGWGPSCPAQPPSAPALSSVLFCGWATMVCLQGPGQVGSWRGLHGPEVGPSGTAPQDHLHFSERLCGCWK